MRQVILFLSLSVFGACVGAQPSVQLCRSLDYQPLASNELMTGKQCSIVVSSDANTIWSGSLFIRWQDSGKGVLLGKGKDPNSRDWMGSHLEPAGVNAFVMEWIDSRHKGFDLYNDDWVRQPGDWFVIDYQAIRPGTCQIDFFDHNYSWIQPDPNVVLIVENIPTRDFNNDDVVNLQDFMLFSSAWMTSVSTDPNLHDQRDINSDGIIDFTDLAMFGEYWLWGSPGWTQPDLEPQPEPEPEPEPIFDPNVIYRICDSQEMQEITLEIQQSVRLYVTQQTLGRNVYVLQQEIQLSDPNMGWIDNTEYDPNAASGTAEILATPRDAFFDYYGPGWYQPQGIQFIAANIFTPLTDGLMSSFVYTASQPGDVVLTIMDYNTFPATTETMIIHQVSQQAASAVPQETVEFLQTLWSTDAEVRQTYTLEDWTSFVDQVENALQTETE